VRGAPAIGIAAAFGVYLGVRHCQASDFAAKLKQVCDYLAAARPTAVNLFWALERMQQLAKRASQANEPLDAIKQRLLDECLAMIEEDNRVCHAIGEHGVELLLSLRPPSAQADRPVGILTHCNAGGLATAQYGTALAPIYVGASRGLRFHVYADETRPLLQGSRITAHELQANGIPVTVICDNMAATVMSQGKVQAVIVGTDRVAANGDVANKIGTLGVAILARHFGLPFYVAAPISSIDLSIPNGTAIPIEQRDPREVSHGFARQTAPDAVDIYNPAFDVTPAELVTALITESGIITPPFTPFLRRLKP
jgi:methylthioribose-1-phosphate isomerase